MAEGTAPGNDANGGMGSGIPQPGEISGDTGRGTSGQQDSGPSPDPGQGRGSPMDSGDGGDDRVSIPGPGEPAGSARMTEAGFMDEHKVESAGPGAGAGADVPGMVQRNSGDDRGSGQAGNIGPSAGIAVVGAAGGLAWGSDTMQGFARGDGSFGSPAREGGHEPPRDPHRDTAHRNVPPETPARIEPENSGSPSRSKGKREEEQDNPSAPYPWGEPPRDPGSVPGKALFFIFSLFGFRRIRKKNVLENDCRKAVFQAIADAPGIDAVSLSRRLEMNINTLRYHLTQLLVFDKITYLARPGTVRYYLNQGMFSPFEQIFLHYLNAGTAGRIIMLVSERPGVSRKDLAEVLGITGPSVTRHIQELSSEGIIRNEPDGRANHYYLTDAAALLLTKLQVIPSGRAARASPAPG